MGKKVEGRLRIIGGEWRGRKLPVADLPGLRPSTDRIRETLFNWLAPEVAGSRCLDLFAGSGALGLEALSRGAAYCQFVDTQRQAVTLLQNALRTLEAGSRAQVQQGDALQFLDRAGPEPCIDLIFLDPPFDSTLLDESVAVLARTPAVSADALCYVEYPPGNAPAFPPDWECWRSKRSGGVVYELYRRNGTV